MPVRLSYYTNYMSSTLSWYRYVFLPSSSINDILLLPSLRRSLIFVSLCAFPTSPHHFSLLTQSLYPLSSPISFGCIVFFYFPISSKSVLSPYSAHNLLCVPSWFLMTISLCDCLVVCTFSLSNTISHVKRLILRIIRTVYKSSTLSESSPTPPAVYFLASCSVFNAAVSSAAAACPLPLYTSFIHSFTVVCVCVHTLYICMHVCVCVCVLLYIDVGASPPLPLW